MIFRESNQTYKTLVEIEGKSYIEVSEHEQIMKSFLDNLEISMGRFQEAIDSLDSWNKAIVENIQSEN